MAVSLASLKRAGDSVTPPRMLIYGVQGIGKNTLAAGAPSPVFIQTEDGMRNKRFADLPTFGLLQSYQEVAEAIGTLATEDHDRQTAVFDSMDWLEPMIWRETARRNGWANIETPDYGKGYTAALDVWREFMDGCNLLCYEKGMCIIFLAHHKIRRFEPPDTEPYDRYMPKLHESKAGIGACPLLQEHADYVLFMNYRVSVVKDQKAGQKQGQGHARGVGGGSRVVYTAERPAFLAKNRDDMPEAIQLPDDPAQAWPAVAEHIPYFNN